MGLTDDLERVLERQEQVTATDLDIDDFTLRTHDIPLRTAPPLTDRIVEYVRGHRGAIADKTAGVSYSIFFGIANELGNAGLDVSEFLKSRAGMLVVNLYLSDKYRSWSNAWLKKLGLGNAPENDTLVAKIKHEAIKTVAELPFFNTVWMPPYAGVMYLSGANSQEIRDAVVGGVVFSFVSGPLYRWYNWTVRKGFGAEKEMV